MSSTKPPLRRCVLARAARYGHKHGFVPDNDFDLLWNTCGTRAKVALGARGAAARREGGGAAATAPLSRAASAASRRAAVEEECLVAERKFLATTSKGFSQARVVPQQRLSWLVPRTSRSIVVGWLVASHRRLAPAQS